MKLFKCRYFKRIKNTSKDHFWCKYFRKVYHTDTCDKCYKESWGSRYIFAKEKAERALKERENNGN